MIDIGSMKLKLLFKYERTCPIYHKL